MNNFKLPSRKIIVMPSSWLKVKSTINYKKVFYLIYCTE